MMRLAVLLVAVGAAAAKPAVESDPSILFGVSRGGRSALGCGSHTLTAGTYTISSPNYPSNYGNNYDCAYNLTPGSGVTSFRVQCAAFSLESHSSCAYDWLSVAGAKYCGTAAPAVTKVGALELAFHSDYSVTSTGFQCTVTARDGSAAQELPCGTHALTPGLYSITSPGYPSNYPNNQDCTYSVSAGSGTGTMELACCQFDLEANSSCSWDWLRVNGVKYCGRQAPALAENGALNIDFHSDSSVVKAGYYCEIRATP